MCDVSYDLLVWDEPPFVNVLNTSETSVSGVVYDGFYRAMKSCCPNMPTINTRKMANQADVMRHMTGNTFGMPISVTNNMLLQDAGMFIRIFDSPGMSLIIREKTYNISLIVDMAGLWPVIAFAAIITGFGALILWFLERLSYNGANADIAPEFIPGYFQSFWVAFISATSVGYGDKVPKSTAAKLFMIIWIFGGLGIIAVFTASITTILTKEQAEVSEDPTLHAGDKIGVLNGTLARNLVIQAGSYPVEANSFAELHTLLEQGQIAGILLNNYYCMHISKELSDHFDMLHRQASAVLTGFVFSSRSSSSSELRTCLNQQIFLTALEIEAELVTDIEHEQDGAKVTSMTLVDGISKTFPILAVSAAALIATLCIVGLIDFLIRKKQEAKHKSENHSFTKISANGV